MLLMATLSVQAEDILQVVPLQTKAGVVASNNQYIEISLTNSFNVGNLQFDLLLPEGMSIVTSKSIFTQRAQTYNEDDDEYIDNFTWSSNTLSSGYTRIVFTPQAVDGDLHPILAGEGVILKIRYKTASDMANGVYPILMTGIELVKSTSESLTDLQASSYVVIGDDFGDDSTNPLKTAETVDLSGMTGYIPSFVVNALNTDLSANSNLATVNLSGATSLGGELNTSALVSMNGGQVSYGREFAAGRWSTVCLPFALSESQVSAIKAAGCEIEKLSDYDESTNYVYFEAVSSMEANTPYLLKSTSAYKPFANLSGVTVSSGTPVAVTAGNMSMKGTFEKLTLSSTASTTYYGYKESDGTMIKVGNNVTVKPYRCYLELAGGSGARMQTIVHSNGEVSAIYATEADTDVENAPCFDLQGRRVSANSQMKQGVYIVNGKKFVK